MIRRRHIKRLSEIEYDDTRRYKIYERKPGKRLYQVIGGGLMTGREAMRFFAVSVYNVETAAWDFQNAGAEFDGGSSYQIRDERRGVVLTYIYE